MLSDNCLSGPALRCAGVVRIGVALNVCGFLTYLLRNLT
jgi:hypothetical protein